MASVVVIANMNSRKNRKDAKRISQLQKIVQSDGMVFPTRNIDDLFTNAIPFIQQYKPEVIASDSGDGGLVPLITALVKENETPRINPPYFPFIAPTAGGTQNVFSKRCGVTSKKEALGYLSEIVHAKPDELYTENFDLMKMEDDRGVTVYGFTFGLGMPVTLLDEYYLEKDKRYLRIAMIVAKCIASYLGYLGKKALEIETAKETFYYARKKSGFYEHFNTKFPISINQEEQQDFLAIMAQTIRGIGMPASNLFYRAEKAEKQFHVIGTKANIDELLLYAPAVYLGKPTPIISEHLDIQTSQMTLSSEKSFLYQVNGELDYLGNPLVANEVKLSYGTTLNIIKTKNTP